MTINTTNTQYGDYVMIRRDTLQTIANMASEAMSRPPQQKTSATFEREYTILRVALGSVMGMFEAMECDGIMTDPERETRNIVVKALEAVK